MNVLVVGKFENCALGSSYAPAFRENGCTVVDFAFDAEYKALSNLTQNRYTNRLFSGHFLTLMARKLLSFARTAMPDLIFVTKGEFISRKVLQKIKDETGALVFQFNTDNPFNKNRGASNHLIRETIPLYDCYFIWGKFLIPELRQAGAGEVEYLPFGYDPKLHYPVVLSEDDRKRYGSDVVFVGTWEKEREEWLETIADRDLTIWGNSWEKMSRRSPLKAKWTGRPAYGTEFRKICAASKIVLNFIRKQNGNAHNMRTFEVPACQGFLLTTRTSEQLDFFKEDEDIACFSSKEELRSKIDLYLQDEKRMNTLKLNAYHKLQPHTYIERAKQILAAYRRLRNQ